MLTKEQKETYTNDGYVILHNIIPSKDLQAMKIDLDHITRKFLLGEDYDPTVISSVQIIFEMLNGLRISSQRDTNRVEIAKEQLIKVRRNIKRLQERNNNLQEQVSTLEEQVKVLEETKKKKKKRK